jgi:hypothetical protein
MRHPSTGGYGRGRRQEEIFMAQELPIGAFVIDARDLPTVRRNAVNASMPLSPSGRSAVQRSGTPVPPRVEDAIEIARQRTIDGPKLS